MRVLVTGASGWIGSAVVPELLDAGHQVTGVARSDDSAATIEKLGAAVVRGSLDDPDGLAAAAAQADGVVHLGYNHDFSQMDKAAETDRAAIAALGGALAGRGGPLIVASGVLGLAQGRPGTEQDWPAGGGHPRLQNAELALSFRDQGVHPVLVRFAPTVHGDGDYGFTAFLAQIAREKGFAGYIDEGENVWPAVHVRDAGRLVRLVVDKPEAGTAVHAIAEEGVPTKAIAEAIGRGLGVPVRSVPAAEAADHFGWMARFFGADVPTSSAWTRETFGWDPTGPTLLDDLNAGVYTR